MADHGENAEAAESGAAPKKKIPLDTLLVLLNTLGVLAALGATVYTKILFQKPVIVESDELKKQIEEAKLPVVSEEPKLVNFEQFLVNIASTSGKAHYATISFSVECSSEVAAEKVLAQKALFTDKVISALGKREAADLNTIQGKLILKNELVREFNALLKKPGSVTNLYLNTFIVQ